MVTPAIAAVVPNPRLGDAPPRSKADPTGRVNNQCDEIIVNNSGSVNLPVPTIARIMDVAKRMGDGRSMG